MKRYNFKGFMHLQALYTSRYDYNFGIVREFIDLPFRDSVRYLKAGAIGIDRIIENGTRQLQAVPLLNHKERFLHLTVGLALLVPIFNLIVRAALRFGIEKVKHHPLEYVRISNPNDVQKKLSQAYKMALYQPDQRADLHPDDTKCFPSSHSINAGKIKLGISEVCGRRPSMEDAYIAETFAFKGEGGKKKEATLFGIFDGHGGSGASHFVANYIKGYVKKSLEDAYRNHKPLDDAFMINALMEAMLNLDKDYDGDAGSTASLTLRMPNGDLWIANSGDSRTVLKNGHSSWPFFGYRVEPLSCDAKPGFQEFKRKVIKRGGFVVQNIIPRVNGILAVAGAIGDNRIVNDLGQKCVSPKPQVVKYAQQNISKESHLIIACDGFWDAVSSRDAVAFVKKLKDRGMSETQIANHLVQIAYDRGSTDNISVMVIPLNPSSIP